ncbi:MAG: DNA repair protein RecN, partial [Oscillospiraceae bacterium]|nr:DNA repair protein RecN [Oscillospiraceae bacterium]
SVLKELGELLITIHGQHDNQILLAPEKHINVLDSFGDIESLISDYKSDFKRLQSLAKKLEKIKRARIEKRDRIILLKNRIDDLKEANISEEEYNELEIEFKQFQNTDRILKSLQIINVILSDENENNTIDMLSKCENELSGISEYSTDLIQLSERFSALKIELQDISDELFNIADSFDTDENRLEYVLSKYNILNNLQKKYGCDYSGLLKLYDESRKELSEMEFSDEELKKITEEKNFLLHQVTDKAKKISGQRSDISELFIRRVTDELRFLDMPNVVIEVKRDVGKLTINGMDNIEFLISANRGEKPKPIAKIASGGELSRIMLALKSVIADKDSVATMVFDEIDTGVSGRAAQKIGIKMKQISKNRQILCVTHLSQLAVMADNHLLIEKNTVNDRTITNVTELDFDGRIKEIARIMGGENPSELIIKSAEEELNRASNI